MTPRTYESTKVPIAKSQDELRGMLRKFGADQFSFGEGGDWAGVEFIHADHRVRVRCPVRAGDPAKVAAHHSAGDRQRMADERERQRVWRVLVWSIKARLVAVDEGLETFEQAFLPHLVDPSTDRTVWQQIREGVEAGMLARGGSGMLAIGAAR